jgi:succinoglycan biosynthesis transport protein ExoP
MLAAEADSELELRDYLRVLRARKWTVAITTAIVVALALGVSLAQTKVYQGVADVLLQPRSTESLFDANSGQRNDPARAVQTEIQVLRSRPVRDLVRKQLGSAPSVSASPVGQTDVIQVKAESTDPERAAVIANAYARSYISFRRSQAVDDLLAAGEQIQAKITDIQKQLDASAAAPQAARDSLLQQQVLFRQKLDELQVDAALKTGGAQLVTPAVAPLSPIRPTPERNAVVALALGLMLGVGLAFLFEYLDDSLKSKDDVERAAPGVSVIALIPSLSGWKNHKDAVVVSATDPKSPAAEAYRTLRTSVQFLSLDRTLQVLQVTSPSQSEGKSTTVANLAVALAGAGKRVVVLDGDLRRPRAHHFFGLDHDIGLTSALLGEVPIERAIRPVPSIPGLSVLASGPIPPNPSELLAGERFGHLLDDLRRHADVVLVDCPPVLPVTDAAVLAGRVDGTLLVVTARDTEGRQLHRAVEVLGQVNATLLGIVLNGVKDDDGYGYSYRYRYAYAADDRPARNGKAVTSPSEPPTPTAIPSVTNGTMPTPAPTTTSSTPTPPSPSMETTADAPGQPLSFGSIFRRTPDGGDGDDDRPSGS